MNLRVFFPKICNLTSPPHSPVQLGTKEYHLFSIVINFSYARAFIQMKSSSLYVFTSYSPLKREKKNKATKSWKLVVSDRNNNYFCAD